jgi:hypothetical protein
MMVRFYEECASGPPLGVRHRRGEPPTSASQLISDCGKQDLALALPARVLLTDPQRATLAEIGKRLGRQPLEPVASVAKPDTIRVGIGS